MKFGKFVDAGVSQCLTGVPAAAEAEDGLAPLLSQLPQRVRGRTQRRGAFFQVLYLSFLWICQK